MPKTKVTFVEDMELLSALTTRRGVEKYLAREIKRDSPRPTMVNYAIRRIAMFKRREFLRDLIKQYKKYL